MQKNTIIYLQKLGFTNAEANIYLQLSAIGASTIAQLSRKTKIPRTSIVRNISHLIDKGIVSYTVRNTNKIYFAENPKKLQNLLSDRQLELEQGLKKISELQEVLPDIVEEIDSSIPENLKMTKATVRYYEGPKGLLDVHKRSLDTAKDEVLFISNMVDWKKIFTDEYAYKDYVPRRMSKNLFARTLAIRSELAEEIKKDDEKYFREMRYLPKDFGFTPTIVITDKEISIFSHTKKPYSVILIQNPAITNMFKEIFNYIWEDAYIQ